MDFKQQLKTYQQMINKELEKYIARENCPEEILNKSKEYSYRPKLLSYRKET